MAEAEYRTREIRAAIVGISGKILTAEEEQILAEYQPLGVIIFARNISDPKQLAELTQSIRQVLARDNAPILIDQEGGRVQRLKAPHWDNLPNAQSIGQAYDDHPAAGMEAAHYLGRAIGAQLYGCGINVACTPVVDLRIDGAHSVIGDRAYHSDPEIVAQLAGEVLAGLHFAGVTGIIKHIPGHGRAKADSHKELPIVPDDLLALMASDFLPFKTLSQPYLSSHIDRKLSYQDSGQDTGQDTDRNPNWSLHPSPWAMTAHVVYSEIDPDLPATLSKRVINEVIRSKTAGNIGFDGIIICDDLGMGAMSAFGTLAEVTRKSFAAGCDIALHCSGKIYESRLVLDASPMVSAALVKKLEQSISTSPHNGLNNNSTLVLDQSLNKIIEILDNHELLQKPLNQKDPTA